jgi:hypothetical protein
MAATGGRLFHSRLDDPFRHSLMGRPAWVRLLFLAACLGVLWLAVAWAVAVP